MSIRGRKQFELTLLAPEWEVEERVDEDSKGRDKELIAARNEHLLYRFVWLGANGERRREFVIKLLRMEFYISESTIGQIIERHSNEIGRIKKELKELENKEPYKKGEDKAVWVEMILNKWNSILKKKFYKW